MSESTNIPWPSRQRRRDQGMTLPELLIAITVMGMILTVLSSAIIVTLRQADNTEGRINVSRSEQTIGMWIPADLSSASTVDTSPDATPCGAAVCDGIDLSAGSNVLLLSWSTDTGSGTPTETNVSYHFALAGDGTTYELKRVECTSSGAGWACASMVVLRNLPGPPAGDPFVPGVANGAACRAPVNPVPCTRPDWVIIVSEPLAADATSEAQVASESERKDANRVIVSINGGGDAEGAGGGINQISITAGGTVRTEIAANSVQGAPSFVEARSRCGGPMTVVVDESNSIGSSITDVKAGVKKFVEALAGTPVQLQVVGFHTYSHVLGSTDWSRYFDMTNQADVNTLLAAINTLQGSWSSNPNGGTNWEEALYRTFYKADGSTADIIPEAVVFFTDGIPTFDRLVYHTSPGIIPAEPPAPSAPWAASTGSSYSQVAFRRADYISNQFRRSVRMIGVGVGSGITQSSNWVSDPGAGYRTQWERGSYSYVRDTIGYEARYQKKDSKNGPYYWVNLLTYNAAASNRRNDAGWTEVTEAEYKSFENPVNTNSNDGGRTVTNSTPVSTAEYNANKTNPLYRAVTKTYNNGPDWEIWTGSRSSGNSNEYRSTKVYNSPPYEGYDPAVTATTRNDVILARMIAGNDNGTPAIWDGTKYTNAEIADMYVLPQWSQFGSAMEAVALGECGGTLTLQTKIGGTTPAPDPFRYQNSAVKDSAGNPVALEPTVVTTNQQFTTGTFDFLVPNGQFVTVDVLPQNYSDLNSYSPGSWSCRAGNQPRSFTPIDIAGAGAWKGVRVRVAANEAVSCTLSVSH
jgi:prepilin-type N-terminal cleavage/methylation domain-containing protein